MFFLLFKHIVHFFKHHEFPNDWYGAVLAWQPQRIKPIGVLDLEIRATDFILKNPVYLVNVQSPPASTVTKFKLIYA